ncbi:phage tail protein [Pseudomonas viridiflava]|uniref:phage tail-collar fiber domain-containing protein n=1 Tax=Pseudomonas viridiflava TaxID=33069 RepID=UPI000F05C687|nr:phage tail protein [Pseudomonas viridiflava]
MGASITLAGENLIAQKQPTLQPLKIARFIFANVPGLNPSIAVDRAAAKPPAAQIVYTYQIPNGNAGYVNPNQVVYSSQLGSDLGDWDFNWVGLESDEGVLFAVSYVPLQQKRRNIPPLQIGNNVTRNFLVVFDGAQALTGITIDASTWQHDFTVRLAGIDERERLSNRDVFGRACFFGTGLQLEKVAGAFQLKAGTAYIEGIRLQQSALLPVLPSKFPTTAWLDVSLERGLNDVAATMKVVFAADRPDYSDSVGVKHYCVALADLPDANTITDRRTVEAINGPLVTHFAARIGDYPNLRARATTKTDVGLGNLPNATSDNPDTDDSLVLATTKALKALGTAIGSVIEKIVSGVTEVGKAAKLGTARKITLDGAVTGEVLFDGSADVKLTAAATQATETVSGGAKVASQAQTNAGTNDAAYVTPKKLRWGFAVSLGATGYIILPTWLSGLTFQWGRLVGVTLYQNFYTVTFPIQFSQVFHIGSDIYRSTVISGTVATLTKPDFTTTGFEICGDPDTNSSVGDIAWFAIGVCQ